MRVCVCAQSPGGVEPRSSRCRVRLWERLRYKLSCRSPQSRGRPRPRLCGAAGTRLVVAKRVVGGKALVQALGAVPALPGEAAETFAEPARHRAPRLRVPTEMGLKRFSALPTARGIMAPCSWHGRGGAATKQIINGEQMAGGVGMVNESREPERGV